MSLRYKSIIIITCFVIVLFLVFFFLSYFIFSNLTKKIEERYALENLQRVKNIIEKEIKDFALFNKGIAFWDQSYNFINKPNQKYIDDNLKETDSNYFNISFAAFTDLEGRDIFSRSYDYTSEKQFKEFLKKLLENGKIKEAFKDKSSIEGVFEYNGSAYIISINPVYDNFKKKPSNGFFITGRNFDEIGLFKVMLNPKSSSCELFSNTKHSTVVNSIRSDLILFNQKVTLNNERTQLISYLLIRNISNQPSLIIKIVQSSSIFGIGREALILYAAISFMIIFILISLLSLFFERFVISKIIKLNENVGLMTANKRFNLNYGMQVKKLKSNDEIGNLNKNIYKMLSTISYRYNVEKLVIDIFNTYLDINEKNFGSFINETLKKTGSFSGADRAIIILFSKKYETFRIAYKWCAAGIEPVIDKFQDLPVENIGWVYNMLKTEGMFHIESPEDLPKDQDKLIDLFATYSTKSALCVAMFFENEMTGCIGFDTTLEEKNRAKKTLNY